MSDLPDEILEAVLCRLQVKPLLRFRCVSKSWNSLIASQSFITSHLQTSRKDSNSAHWKTIVAHGNQLRRGGYAFFIPHIKPQFPPRTNISDHRDDPSLEVMSDCYVSFVGCCNGLICLRPSRNFDYYLWNPAIRVYKKLSSVNQPTTDYVEAEGLGFDELNGDYKVFCQFDTTVAKLYSLKTDSWRTIECIGGYVPDTTTLKFVNGKLYMVWAENQLSSRFEIVSFDLQKEVYGKVQLPTLVQTDDSTKIWPGKLDECFCLLHEITSGWDVWVLRQHEQHESWTKFVTIPYRIKKPIPSLVSSFREPNGDQILAYHLETRYMIVRPQDNTAWLSPQWGDRWIFYAHVYIESLVEPVSNGQGWNHQVNRGGAV